MFRFFLEMNRGLLTTIICLTTLFYTNGYQGPFRRLYSSGEPTVLHANDDCGDPLFLTPYIEQGKLEEARNLRLKSIFNIFSLIRKFFIL